MRKIFIFLCLIIGYTDAQKCPDASSILPCVCRPDASDPPSMSCSGITSEDQLETIFSVDFPQTEMVELRIDQSSLDQLSRNVFGSVSFQSIFLDSYYVQLISEDAFENSRETLQDLHIYRCKVSQDTFPFSTLNSYTALTSFEFQRNEITAFPEISSESIAQYAMMQNTLGTLKQADISSISNLTNLLLSECGIDAIEEGAFESNAAIATVSIEKNPLSTLPPSIFHNLPNLINVFMGHNEITALEPEIFNSASGNVGYVGFNNNNLTTILTDTFKVLSDPYTLILLDHNMINTIEDNAFGSITNATLDLKNNQLTELKESWMRPLLDAYCYIDMDENPFTCGCEIAWLFEEPSYQSQVAGHCPDGESISDLDPDYFQDNCL